MLQCRSLRLPKSDEIDSRFSENIPHDRILYKSNRAIGAGNITDIRYIIYIDPKEYYNLKSINKKKTLGRIVGRLNQLLANRQQKIMLMGPGRWGSSNIELGVNVGFCDIANVSVLVEIASEEAGYSPEVSYGTHFFLDLVEAGIIYLPLYPDEPDTCFNSAFFKAGKGELGHILPEYAEFENTICVIDLEKIPNTSGAGIMVNPKINTAFCYLSG